MSFTDFFIYIGPSLIIATVVVGTYLICKLVRFKEMQYNTNDEQGTEISKIELVVNNNNEEDEIEINGYDSV
jgi:hypothetical protein